VRYGSGRGVLACPPQSDDPARTHMPLPNFFVIGAAKAGTTAFADALAQHTCIYMCPLKEPFFFALDGNPGSPDPAGRGILHRMVWQPQDYMALFADATTERAIGEASTAYLRSPQAARRIKRSLPTSKFIAILRQPADRAYSHHRYMATHNVERAPTLKAAIEEEVAGLRTGWFSGVHYKAAGYYHQQLSVYFALFPRDCIKVYLYEDWQRAPQTVLRDAFGFLEVDENFAPQVRQMNVTRTPRSPRVHRLAQLLAQRHGDPTSSMKARARSVVAGSLDWIDRTYNLRAPEPFDPTFRRQLTGEYREDILKLQDLIDRDLSEWLL